MQNDNPQSGFLLINKPSGPTSHDVINRLRKITGIRKIGHAGTLDPFASGLLIAGIGRDATRQISKFVKLDKEYIATLRLGAISDTHDRTGVISQKSPPKADQRLAEKAKSQKLETIEIIIKSFVGRQLQVPPMFSAKKIKGKKLYELARQGIEIERKPAGIEIYSIVITKYAWPHLELKVHCSSGTYIRSLAHDIGQALGCGAYLDRLVRTRIGGYGLDNAIYADQLDPLDIKFLETDLS